MRLYKSCGLAIITTLIVCSFPAFSQDKSSSESTETDTPTLVEIYSSDDAAAVLDARIIALKTVLKLDAEQQKLWSPVEDAIREIALRAAERNVERSKAQPPANIVDILDRTADAEIVRGNELKKFSAAMKPLISVLTFEQQMRIPAFLGMQEKANGLPQPTYELWLFEAEQ